MYLNLWYSMSALMTINQRHRYWNWPWNIAKTIYKIRYQVSQRNWMQARRVIEGNLLHNDGSYEQRLWWFI